MSTLWAIAAGLIIVPVGFFCLQVCAGLPARRVEEPLAGARPSIAVLIPAHDEENLIAATVQAVALQLEPGDRLLVVADNCSDATAPRAAAAGAEVLEREDHARRGKGYALDFGVRHLEARAPQIVIVIDADCTPGAQAIDRLARLAQARARPVQALYTMASGPGAGLRTRMAAFAWIVKNHLRPLGLARLGLPCQLMGTGMAFRWEEVQRAPLATGHLAEDVMIGVELARAGAPPLFCPDASVASVFPPEGALRTQRTRWEHGNFALLARVPGLLVAALARRDIALASLALDLCIPPLALLVTTTLILTLGAAAAGTTLAFTCGLSSLGAIALSVLLAWNFHGRAVLPLADLARVPLYVLWKLPIYLRLLTGREARWIRTRREGE
jgi:cellulose synthase/poly-beta-1,6-N-acetylglucosamine synthase-like glycosyltransferase